MPNFQNIKVIGVNTELGSRSTLTADTDASIYTTLNVLNLDDFWVASLSGAIKSSMTSISATISGTISAGAYGLDPAQNIPLTASAFVKVRFDNGQIWKIPLFKA